MALQRKQGSGWKGIVLLLLLAALVMQALADPTGTIVSSATTAFGPTSTPAVRSDNRSSITTMILNAVQQDGHWKAYVGNISGSLVLENPYNMTIYAWDMVTITGQVYASRFNNLSWSSVSCADGTTIQSEDTFNNMSAIAVDRTEKTFNWSVHKQFQVGPSTILSNTCNSTVTYTNSTRQTPTNASPFQELLVKDTNSQLIYMTAISAKTQGYDNSTYDFQMIVGESDIKPSATPYYFYVELR